MKQFLILLLLTLRTMGWGQVQAGKDIGADKYIQYITVRVVDSSKATTKGVTFRYGAVIDYGQDLSIVYKDKNTTVYSKMDFVNLQFVSIMEIFNYLNALGWEYREMFPETTRSYPGYLFVRK